MATIRLFLKSVPNKEIQKIFFRYRPSKQMDLLMATPFEVKTSDWDSNNQCWNKDQFIQGARSSETKTLNDQIKKFNDKIENFKIKVGNFIDEVQDKDCDIQKKEIKDFVIRNYFANRIKVEKTASNKIPNNFISLIDFYIEQRSIEDRTKGTRPLAQNTVKKYRTLQNLLKSYDKNLLATQINDVWRNNFVNWLNKKEYSTNTQVKFIKDIKMLCKFSNKDNAINKQVLAWEINSSPQNVSEFVTLTFTQLDTLKKAVMPKDSLSNARDWFIISCYSSVRVSELMELRAENIIEDGGDYYIQVAEKKTGNNKIIYLLPQVVDILNKRQGNFPRPISHQRYNEYIKDVCMFAGLDEEIENGIIENGRKVIKKLPFHRFVKSHSGRATYVTLFKDKIPSEIIQMQTNHHSAKMVEHYDKTDEVDKMMIKAKSVAQAHRSLDNYKSVILKVV